MAKEIKFDIKAREELKKGVDDCHGLVDAALEVHGICSGSHILQADVDDRLSQNGSGGSAVAGQP